MQRFHGEFFVILAGEDHDRHAGRFLQYFAERIRAATVGKIQIQQHHRRRMLGYGCQPILQAVHAAHVDPAVTLDQTQPDQVGVTGVVFN